MNGPLTRLTCIALWTTGCSKYKVQAFPRGDFKPKKRPKETYVWSRYVHHLKYNKQLHVQLNIIDVL